MAHKMCKVARTPNGYEKSKTTKNKVIGMSFVRKSVERRKFKRIFFIVIALIIFLITLKICVINDD